MKNTINLTLYESLRTFPLWKLAILFLSLLFTTRSFKNDPGYFIPRIDFDFCYSLLLVMVTLPLSVFLVQKYLKSRDSLFYNTLCFLENKVFKTFTLWILLFCSLFIFLIIIAVSSLVFDNVPRVTDEIAQLFQAKIFLSGHLSAPPPPLPEFFTSAEDNMIVQPKWYSQYPPGFSSLLMIGLRLGSPWIVNPLLAALSVLLVFLLCRETFDRTTAILSGILFILSPKVIFTSASLMNHTSSMFFFLLSVTTIVLSLKRQNSFLALCSGLSLGMSLNIRTLDAIVLYLPVGVYSLVIGFKSKGFRVRILGMWLFGFCLMAGILFFYNYKTNGDPLLFGYIVRWGQNHTLGFHEIRGGWVHTPFLGIVNTLRQIRLTDKGIFEWPLPVIFFIVLLFLFAKTTLWDWIFLLIIGCNVAFYFFWGWYDRLFMGRFYFNLTPFIVILTSRGLLCFVKLFSMLSIPNIKRFSHTHSQPVLALTIAGMLLLFSIPAYIADLIPQYYLLDLQVDRRIEKVVKEKRVKNAIVFIEAQDKNELLLGSGFFMNTPNLETQDVIYAKDLGKKNPQLLSLFKGRKGFLYRHKREVKKIINQNGLCESPPEAFELIELST